jgi:hypothetical protein
MNAKDHVPDKMYHGLFLGPSGAGKTCAGVTVGDTDEKFAKVLILDLDNRWEGIKAHPHEKVIQKIREGFVEYERYNKPNVADNVKDLETRVNSIRGDVMKGVFQTIILSSTTSANDMFKENARLCSSIQHHSILGKVVTQKQDYLYIDRAQRDLIVETLNKLPCNVIIEAHLTDDGYNKTVNNEDIFIVTGKKINLPGKLGFEAPTWFNETYEFYVDETNPSQVAYMVKFKGMLAKTSFANMPQNMNVTGKHFYSLISGIRDGKLDKLGREIKK